MIQILLADDHAIFREGLASLLTSDPEINIKAEAENGEEAWRMIQEIVPDIAILDISMPGLNGMDVAASVKKSGLGTQIIFLTSHDDPSLAIQGKSVGMAGYVLKENSYKELIVAVKTVYNGKTFMSAQVTNKLGSYINSSQSKSLSRREKEVLTEIAMGHTNKEIARILNITPRTVDTHKTRIKEKLDLRTISALSLYAIKTGLVR
ncbi:MAG: response regulator transcription factor [Magnetococcales bacterium]|nr:response regulator transcription factor [Magnetococcales bacterium]